MWLFSKKSVLLMPCQHNPNQRNNNECINPDRKGHHNHMTTILQSYPTSTIPLSRSDRLQQTCIIGANGVGKSNTLLKLILRDVHAGYGLCLLDPHGELLTDVVKRLPRERGRDVVLLSLTNPELSFGLNLFACRDPHDPIAVQDTVSTVVNIFEKVFGLDRASMGRQLTYLRS